MRGLFYVLEKPLKQTLAQESAISTKAKCIHNFD